MLDPKLMEAIDVCRPGSRDAEQPELAALADSLASDLQVQAMYETVQRLDLRLSSAMQEVPVPAGLANRILDRLAATPEPCAAAAMAVSATAAPMSNRVDPIGAAPVAAVVGSAVELNLPSSIETSSGRRNARRRWIAVGLGLAACLLLAVGLALRGQPDPSPLTVAEKAVGWYEQLGHGWRPMAEAPKGFSVPKGIGGTLRGWQSVAKTVATSGVVYELGQGPPGPVSRSGAVLFVLKATRSDLPSSAPRTPQSTTAGFAIGAWQSGGLMYVLVVRGNEQAYQKLLHPVQPLA